MSSNDHFVPNDADSADLAVIQGINFTPREIDILSCLINVRGTSKISSLLSISPNTIRAHTRNIKLKLGYTSRECVIDFIERSYALPLIKKHYTNLVLRAAFEKCLKNVKRLPKKAVYACLMIHEKEEEYKKSLKYRLENHLKQAGLNVDIREKHVIGNLEDKSRLFFIPLGIKKQQEMLENFSRFDFINVTEYPDYYFLFFAILKKILPNVDLDPLLSDFVKQSKINSNCSNEIRSNIDKNRKLMLFGEMMKKLFHNNSWLLFSALFIFICYCGFHYITGRKEPQVTQIKESPIRSPLSIPVESVLLQRPQELAKIDNSFKNQKDGIQTLALVGMGGVGKTTLARQYAYSHDSHIVWEINAETPESLKSSLENFATNLSKSEEDNKTLVNIQDLRHPQKKEDEILSFIKEKLRDHPHWVIIFDNVENFPDIQKFFPSDPIAWGKGKVIVTTRNKHLQQNNQIKASLLVGALSPQEQLHLFTRIMDHGKIQGLAKTKADETKKFLEKLSPYPLDISIAAYYLKATNISYLAYLDNLANNSCDCAKIQENLLKESGGYTKTRYGIITLSLQHLIKENKDFRDLLLLISLIDSQNIPRDFLASYKNNIIVDDLMYNLHKYSFVSNNTLDPSSEAAFSIHRSTQQTVLAFLISTISLGEKNDLISSMAHVLEDYIDNLIEKEEYLKMNLLVNHCDVFISHKSILSNKNKKLLSLRAGQINFHLDNLEKAKQYLEKSLEGVNEHDGENAMQIAQSLAYLGMTYRELCNAEKAIKLLKKSLIIYDKYPESTHKAADAMGYLGLYYKDIDRHQEATNLLEKCLTVYKKMLPEYHPKRAKILVYLGMIHREVGNYEKAKDLFLNALAIYSKFPEYHIREAYALAFLGNVYRDLGDYKHSKKLLEKSLAIYKKTFPNNKTKPLWVMVYLGKTQMALGHYEAAKNLFQESIKIYKEHPGHFMEEAWTLENFGTLYRELGEYYKAKKLIEQANEIYKNHSYKNYLFVSSGLLNLARVYIDLGHYTRAKTLIGKVLSTHGERYAPGHAQTALPLKYLGQVHFLEGNLEKAKELFLKSLEILEQHDHPEKCTVLENLSDLYLKKASLIEGTQNKNEQNFRDQAESYLKAAYHVAKVYFPDDSAHIKRIQEKIKKFE